MSLDIRSQMAVNLCANLDMDNVSKFRNLARICNSWGFSAEESFPIAYALKEKLGITEFQLSQEFRAVLDVQEMELRKRN